MSERQKGYPHEIDTIIRRLDADGALRASSGTRRTPEDNLLDWLRKKPTSAVRSELSVPPEDIGLLGNRIIAVRNLVLDKGLPDDDDPELAVLGVENIFLLSKRNLEGADRTATLLAVFGPLNNIARISLSFYVHNRFDFEIITEQDNHYQTSIKGMEEMTREEYIISTYLLDKVKSEIDPSK